MQKWILCFLDFSLAAHNAFCFEKQICMLRCQQEIVHDSAKQLDGSRQLKPILV